MDGGHKVNLDASIGLIGSDGGFHAAGLRSGFHEAEKLGAFLGKERACGCAQKEKAEDLKEPVDGESHNCLGVSCICFWRSILAIVGRGASLDFEFAASLIVSLCLESEGFVKGFQFVLAGFFAIKRKEQRRCPRHGQSHPHAAGPGKTEKPAGERV